MIIAPNVPGGLPAHAVHELIASIDSSRRSSLRQSLEALLSNGADFRDWNSLVLVVGAELNAELPKQSAQGQFPQKDQPASEDTPSSRGLTAFTASQNLV